MLTLFVGTVLAGPFIAADLPLTLSFAYAWDEPEVSGVAAFTFTGGVLRETTAVCEASRACMDGRFTTGNGGTGSFSTDLRVTDCVLRFAAYSIDADRVIVPAECAVRQDLTLFYDNTSATYAGSASFGSVAFERVFDCSTSADCPLELDQGLEFRVVPEAFSGQLAGPSTGSFDEM
jgi:hypothetical protein